MNFSNWSWSNWKGRKTKITSSHCFTTKPTTIDHFKNNTNDIHWNICNKILSQFEEEEKIHTINLNCPLQRFFFAKYLVQSFFSEALLIVSIIVENYQKVFPPLRVFSFILSLFVKNPHLLSTLKSSSILKLIINSKRSWSSNYMIVNNGETLRATCICIIYLPPLCHLLLLL